jgi:hypothetical protein
MRIGVSTRIVFLTLALAGNPLLAQARGGHSSSHSHSYSSGSGYVNSESHYIHGYTQKNGTYVPGHYATNPNGIRNDNYSTRGNVNPWTGKFGSKPGD